MNSYKQLLHDEFCNVDLCPWKIIRVNNQAFIEGGIVSPSKLPAFARHHRGNRIADLDTEHATGSDRLVGKYIWGGCYHEHFGHFIAEFVHRLWVASRQEYSGLTVLFCAQKEDYRLHATFKDLMSYFGISKWKIITTPVEVETLVIAEQGSHLNSATKPAYSDWLLTRTTKVQVQNTNSPDKICVLRGHNTGGRLLSEQQLEEFLVEEGYIAVRPEELPLTKQLELLFNAKKIIFSEGSALHLFDLLPKCDAEVAVINRRPNATLANTTLCDKVERFITMDEVSIVYVPTVSGKKDPNRALSYVPIGDIVSRLETEKFIELKSRPTLKVSEDSLKQDFLTFLASNQSETDTSSFEQSVTELLFEELARRFKQNRALNTEVTLLKAQAAIKDGQYEKAKPLVDHYNWLSQDEKLSKQLLNDLYKLQE